MSTIKVKASFGNGKFGFYGSVRRYDGDEFELTDPKHFSESWMIKLTTDKPKTRRKSAAKPEVTEGNTGE